MERHSFCVISGESPETMRKLCLSLKFLHQEIRWNHGLFLSETAASQSEWKWCILTLKNYIPESITERKVFLFGVFLIRIFQYSVNLLIQSGCRKIWIRIIFTQWIYMWILVFCSVICPMISEYFQHTFWIANLEKLHQKYWSQQKHWQIWSSETLRMLMIMVTH